MAGWFACLHTLSERLKRWSKEKMWQPDLVLKKKTLPKDKINMWKTGRVTPTKPEYSSKALRILTWITANIRDTVQHVHLFNDLPKLSRQGVFKDNKFWRHAACLVRKFHGNHVRPMGHDLPCGRCLRCWTAWCDAATFEKSSSGTTPNAREQLLLRSCGVLLLISKYLFLLFSYFYTALAQRVTGNPSSVPQSGNVEMMTSLFLADISMAWGEAMASAGCGGYRCV